MSDPVAQMDRITEEAMADLQKALEHLQLAASEHAATVAALARALAESHAEHDRLAEQLRKTREELEIQQYWCRLDPNDQAVLVLCDVDQDEGTWTAVVRNREEAQRLAELVDNDDDEVWYGRKLTVLDGAVTVKQAALWNAYEPVKRPRGDQ